jgi:hypothetical protein
MGSVFKRRYLSPISITAASSPIEGCFPSGKFGQHVVIPKLWIGKIQTIGGGIHEIQRKERA